MLVLTLMNLPVHPFSVSYGLVGSTARSSAISNKPLGHPVDLMSLTTLFAARGRKGLMLKYKNFSVIFYPLTNAF